jgi:hypothetical protein
MEKRPPDEPAPSHTDTELAEWARNPKNPVNWSPARQGGVIFVLWGANTVAYVFYTYNHHAPCHMYSV